MSIPETNLGDLFAPLWSQELEPTFSTASSGLVGRSLREFDQLATVRVSSETPDQGVSE